MKIVNVSLSSQSLSSTMFSSTNIITSTPSSFMATQFDYNNLKKQYGCLDSIFFSSQGESINQLLETVQSSRFSIFSIFAFFSSLMIISLRVFHIYRIDILTVYQNYKSGLLNPHNKNLISCQILSYLEFSFLYFAHFQIFNILYYSNFYPCFGVKHIQYVIPIITDSTRILLMGSGFTFFSNVILTYGIFFIILFIIILFYTLQPLQLSSLFRKPLSIIIRSAAYLLGSWVLCRIGVFMIYQPTYVLDDLKIISKSLSSLDYLSVFGYIPEILELILVLIDLIIEAIFWQIGKSMEGNIKLVPTQNLRKRNDDFTPLKENEIPKAKISFKMKSTARPFSGTLQIIPQNIALLKATPSSAYISQKQFRAK